jgi:intraflagellar transport protein 80
MNRSTVVTGGKPIYCLVWSPMNDSILYCCDKNLTIVPTLPGHKQVQWKAHDGVVLQADWNPANNLIVSCGEDCKYRVWDSYGRQLYSSLPYDHVITSVKWSPNGDMFAVGAFEMLRLCDKSGWTHSFDKPASGSLLSLSWSHDGTVVCGAGGNGSVTFGYIADRQMQWANVEAVLDQDNRICVIDPMHGINEELEFTNRVVNMSMSFGYIVVCTTNQCYVYNIIQQNWASPFVFDVKDCIMMIVQGHKYFAMIDASLNFNVYSYDGKLVSSPKFQGLRVEFLNKRHISISSDVLAVIDPINSKIVRVFDVMSGKPATQIIEHSTEVCEMDLNQIDMASERKMCFVDSNRDMFLTLVHKPEAHKICNMVDSFMWNDGNDMLACLSDGKLVTWFYPNAIYVDKDLMLKSTFTKEV